MLGPRTVGPVVIVVIYQSDPLDLPDLLYRSIVSGAAGAHDPTNYDFIMYTQSQDDNITTLLVQVQAAVGYS